ncbi:hypothetical protein TEU_09015 [Thermococcus eurythermalis]|uniref:Uncharacterized protein n=1 Tax=Thermococcus eurythermalis TaxID=1505907 RepID=A0A097QVG2_9EURY|nr:hypothetical protein TEU_09015 [Thermococcus eurythermalis]
MYLILGNVSRRGPGEINAVPVFVDPRVRAISQHFNLWLITLIFGKRLKRAIIFRIGNTMLTLNRLVKEGKLERILQYAREFREQVDPHTTR